MHWLTHKTLSYSTISCQVFSFSDHGVDLTEPTAISKTCQRHPKTPRGTPEHGTSIALCRRIWNFDGSSGVVESHKDINPTCGVWRQNLVSRFQLKLYWTGQTRKVEVHNEPHYISKISATIARITIPVQSCSSFDWAGRHLAQAKCCQSETSNTPSLTSHVMNNHQPGTRHDATVYNRMSDLKSYLVPGMNSNSHPVPCWSKSKKNYKTSRLDPIGHQALSRTLMANYRNLFNLFRFSDHLVDLTEPTAISKTCQRHPKTPRGTPEHRTSIVPCRRIWNYDVSSRIGEAQKDMNPTCGVWRQNLVSRFQLKLYWTGQIGKI